MREPRGGAQAVYTGDLEVGRRLYLYRQKLECKLLQREDKTAMMICQEDIPRISYRRDQIIQG